jgi:PKD repeat protein
MNTSLGGNGWFMQIGDEPRDVRIHHNTIDSNGSTVVYVYGGTCASPRPVVGFEYVANAARFGTYGVNSPCGTGNPTLAAYYPGAEFRDNYLAGASLSRYPPGTINVVPFEAQFADSAHGDYTVVEGSPLKRRTTDEDSGLATDIGVDFAGLVQRLVGVPNPAPPALPTRPTAAAAVTCTFLDCVFADQSSEGSGRAIVERLWSFGDDSVSTEPSGTHRFAAAGTYAITLLVRDANSLEDFDRVTVTVRPPNVPPTAAFESACVDLICVVTDRSSDGDGTIVSWAWTFGTAGSSSEPSPTFTFAAPDTYTVTLTVTDNEGATATATAAVDVKAVIHAALVDSTVTEEGTRRRSPWRVTAIVAIHGADERPIPDATITATWTGTSRTTTTCVTGSDGRCTFDSGRLAAARISATLTVLNVSAPLSVYQRWGNHDATGMLTGMSWTFLKP